jgi:flagellar FliL protein
MIKLKTLFTVVAVAAIGAAGAGGAMWWMGMRPPATQPQAAASAAHAPDTRARKYITLEKVIVMLRRAPGETVPHYLAADLVIGATDDKERLVKEHLPMLRSVAVRALSAFPMSKAEGMTVDQIAADLNRAFADVYAKEGKERPFTDVMIGKLIIE